MDNFNSLSDHFKYELIDYKNKLFRYLHAYLKVYDYDVEHFRIFDTKSQNTIMFHKASAFFQYDILQKKVVYEHYINNFEFYNKLKNKKFLNYINIYIKDYNNNKKIYETYHDILKDTFKNIKYVKFAYGTDFKLVYFNNEHLVLENNKKSLYKTSIIKFISDIIDGNILLEDNYLYMIERNLKLINREENLTKILKVL